MSEMADLATGLQHVGIPVKNMDDAVHFYKSLGFEEAFRAAGHEAPYWQKTTAMTITASSSAS